MKSIRRKKHEQTEWTAERNNDWTTAECDNTNEPTTANNCNKPTPIGTENMCGGRALFAPA